MAATHELSESQEFGRWGQPVPSHEFGRGFPQVTPQEFGRWGMPAPAQEFGRGWPAPMAQGFGRTWPQAMPQQVGGRIPFVDQGWRSPRLPAPPSTGRYLVH